MMANDEFPLPKDEEMVDMMEGFMADPEVNKELDRAMKDAPIMLVGAVGLILYDGDKRIAQVLTMTGGVINPSRRFGFPPKEARDGAAKEFARSMRKRLIKAMDGFAKGRPAKAGTGAIVTGQIDGRDGTVKGRKEKSLG